jgi:hypothetical protein
MYSNHTGLPPVDPELAARHSQGHGQSFHDRFGTTLIAVGGLIGLLIVLSVIGRFVA